MTSMNGWRYHQFYFFSWEYQRFPSENPGRKAKAWSCLGGSCWGVEPRRAKLAKLLMGRDQGCLKLADKGGI